MRSISAFALPALLMLQAAPAIAGANLKVMPIRVEMSMDQTIGSLILGNESDQPVSVQIRGYDWDQEDGQDQLTPTNDLLVNPRIVTIDPHGSQIIRVGLPDPKAAEVETSYRLFIDELPSSPVNPGLVQTLLRLSLPVFLSPDVATEASLNAELLRNANGTAEIGLTNDGNVHVQILSYKIVGKNGSILAQQNVSQYLLPGKRAGLLDAILAGTGEKAASLHLVTDAGDMELPIKRQPVEDVTP